MASVESWPEHARAHLAAQTSTAWTERPPVLSPVQVLGVRITDTTMAEAIQLFGELMTQPDGITRMVYFANAHTLNLAWERPDYREVLNRADHVFGDGTGVRWGARLKGVHLRDNVNGTDAVPLLFERMAGHGLRYFLLGAQAEVIERAAATAERQFAGWQLAGCHHGYLDAALTEQVIEQINAARPHLLLVGMGNPLQEFWLDQARAKLKVPLCMATGGLFQYWAGNLDRAPAWFRRAGIEWLHILRRQPHKLRRYGLGNPVFVARILRDRLQWS
jgi:N-acetylglucosaminyldiphosphoundecaprenol N-acetyl-beta-D-mannosaminyltransferase